MGTVYRANDSALERDVAIKLMSNSKLGTEGRTRLLREAKLVAKLDHPNIVTVFDTGEVDKNPYIVMQLVEGHTLYEKPPKGLEEITTIMRQVCTALEHAHNNGIIHRDLKPENVIIETGGKVKLMDFGLARSVASRLTSEGTIIGTVFYMAPEIALGQEIDERTDLYSLGVMLYELTTGVMPFEDADPVAVISQHIHAPVVPPRAKNEDLPPALNDLIVSLLSKAPADHPASASEVIGTLDSPNLLDKDATPAEELTMLDRIVRGRMVGRKKEFEDARAAWKKAAAGDGQLLLISGEPGIGKTRLTREISTHADVTGGQVFVGASYAEGDTPYAPFRQILREALSGKNTQEIDLPDFVLADLLFLAPDLRSRYPESITNQSKDLQIEQQSLFENFAIFINKLSEQAPLLLVLEDVHWADSGTLYLMRYLARNTRKQRVMITPTYREVELDEARPLHEVLLDIERENLAARIKLSRLTRDQAQDMLAAMFAEDIPDEILNGIYRETEGNPFFIEEVCKALVESGKFYYQAGEWHSPDMAELGIPQSVRVAIQSRLGKLPKDVQDILRQAAFLGREFNFETLALAAELDEDTLIDGLESAERAQLIEELESKEPITFAFVHALIPTTLVEGVRTLKRRRLHRRAANAIEALHPDDLEALAYHFLEAGETEKAVGYLLQVADQARVLYAHQEAIDSYLQALEFLKESEHLESAARTQMKLALTYHNAFEFAKSRQAYQEGFNLWQRAGETGPAETTPAPHALRLVWGDPISLDPGFCNDNFSAFVSCQLFSGLVELTPNLNILPDAARKWEVLDEGRKYIFHLRKNMLWSDGIPVTAGDFEFAWKRMLAPEENMPGANLLYDITNAKAFHQGKLKDIQQVGITAKDDLTLIVELEEPASYFLQMLAGVIGFPIPQHTLAEHGEAWTDLDKMVTNGPFRIVGWERGKSMLLKYNPGYNGRISGNFQEMKLALNWNQIEEILHMYEHNKLDAINTLFISRGRVRAHQKYAGDYVTGPLLLTQYIGFNVEQPPFDDSRVRQAIILATNREFLADEVVRGLFSPATGGYIPLGMPGHSPKIGLPYDPDKGKELLAEAGYAGGGGFPTIEALASSGRQGPGTAYLQTQWLEILGIEINWTFLEFDMLLEKLKTDNPQMWFIGWTPNYPDPDDYLRISSAMEETNWRNNQFQQLVKKARRLQDQPERIKLYQQADKILIEDAAILPLLYGRNHLLIKPWVRNYPMTPLTAVSLKDVIIEPHEE